jgi:hypothetical protein
MKHFLMILGFITIIASCKNKTVVTEQIKSRLNSEISNILILDQKYRWQLMYGESNETKLDSLKKLPDSIRYAIFAKMFTKQYGLTKKQSDSIWILQNHLDSLNEIRLSQIIDSFGWPSAKLIGPNDADVLPLHFSKEFKSKYYPTLFQAAKDKDIAADVVAQMYDRLMIDLKKQQVYGSFEVVDSITGKKSPPMIDDINLTNKMRHEIGLDSLIDYRLSIKKN